MDYLEQEQRLLQEQIELRDCVLSTAGFMHFALELSLQNLAVAQEHLLNIATLMAEAGEAGEE